MRFHKYHALGNDYLCIQPEDLDTDLSPMAIRTICHRNYGVGSDGILLGPLPSDTCDVGLRILNPDGSEAEKSGNGLRIFARFLQDQKRVGSEVFSVETLGGTVTCAVAADGREVTVEMGQVVFDSTTIPVTGAPREVLKEEIEVADQRFTFCAASVGNPHCVILDTAATVDLARQYGPQIETDARFPQRINVQFMEILDRRNLRIEIWERGAGYTLASGSSSTAAAAVAIKLGYCDPKVTVHMPGGKLALAFDADYGATMTGPVTRVAEGQMAAEMFTTVLPAES